ncbi:MAG TPA: efflux RND transporter periplasmic adaptor subunit [Kiritimatiellia bacterium]|nr:efflux RND transporter periplasmic adaptor subunit [Kiritimatiellia bacterium]HRZ11760.1 efflux RND transporter periplasmic adaptor subunit [Kiritimatiellia bacterium]HSA17433.1 efflux RND transporter periplasmic adaptor subunit [Kiritimatiellia bacterium]
MKAILGALVLAALPAMAAPEETAVRGELFCSVERRVVLPYPGTITAIAAEVGQDVKRGDPLLQFTLSRRARAELEPLASQASQAAAEAEVAGLEAEAGEARAAAEEAERLAREQLGTRPQADLAKSRVAALDKRLTAARERAEYERRQRDTNLRWLKEGLGIENPENGIPETVPLPAPMDGTVIWISGDARPGVELDPSTPLLTLGVMDPMIVRAHVHELDVVKLKVGDRAHMTLLARPDAKLEGAIRRIAWAPFPHWLPEPSYFEVELTVPNPDRALRQGYKVNLQFGDAAAE